MKVSHSEFVEALLDPRKPVPNGLTFRSGKTEKRFAVYRNNVAVSLTEALQSLFPVLRKLIGDEFFRALAGVYLRRHPPESPLLSRFGRRMPDFLSNFEPVGHLPYLSDVARLEILIKESFHAKDTSPVDNEYLASFQPTELLKSTLSIAPSTRILQSRFPIFGIWQANVSGGGRPINRAEEVLVARQHFEPRPILMPEGGCKFIASLASGSSISAAADIAAAERTEFRLDEALTILLRSGSVSGINPDVKPT